MTLDAVAAELASLIQRVGAGVDSSGRTAPRISRKWAQRNVFPNILCRSPTSEAVRCTEGSHRFQFSKNPHTHNQLRID
jgi:hypothetical protein